MILFQPGVQRGNEFHMIIIDDDFFNESADGAPGLLGVWIIRLYFMRCIKVAVDHFGRKLRRLGCQLVEQVEAILLLLDFLR